MLTDDASAGRHFTRHYSSDSPLNTVMRRKAPSVQQHGLIKGEVQPSVLFAEPLGFNGRDFVFP